MKKLVLWVKYYEKFKFFKFITNRALLFCTCCCLRNCIKFSMSKHVKNITNNQFLQLFSTLEPSGCVQHNVRHDIIIFFQSPIDLYFLQVFTVYAKKSQVSDRVLHKVLRVLQSLNCMCDCFCDNTNTTLLFVLDMYRNM